MLKLYVILACLVLGSSSKSNETDSLKVTVFYETYCPYSVRYFLTQLYPTWQEFKEYIKLELVPFGNAEQTYENGTWTFDCQHGVKECVGNTLHACAIEEACGGGTLNCPVDKLSQAMEYINCSLSHKKRKKASDQCAKDAELNHNSINTCADGIQGQTLLSQYGNQTKAFKNPRVTYVPFTAFNDERSPSQRSDAYYNLTGVVCSYLSHLDQC